MNAFLTRLLRLAFLLICGSVIFSAAAGVAQNAEKLTGTIPRTI
ncbi:MAG TPA: hypothetical protein V6D13_14985 [Halomicronema sp.]